MVEMQKDRQTNKVNTVPNVPRRTFYESKDQRFLRHTDSSSYRVASLRQEEESEQQNQSKQTRFQTKQRRKRTSAREKKRVSENGANEWKAKFENMEKQKMGN